MATPALCSSSSIIFRDLALIIFPFFQELCESACIPKKNTMLKNIGVYLQESRKKCFRLQLQLEGQQRSRENKTAGGCKSCGEGAVIAKKADYGGDNAASKDEGKRDGQGNGDIADLCGKKGRKGGKSGGEIYRGKHGLQKNPGPPCCSRGGGSQHQGGSAGQCKGAHNGSPGPEPVRCPSADQR